MNANEYKILNLLYGENRPLFFREISKISKVSIGGTQKVLKDYSDFLVKEARGRNTYFSFRNDFLGRYLKLILESRKAIYLFGRNKKLKSFFEEIVRKGILCLVFGSFARGTEKKSSDLDLIVLSDKTLPEHLSVLKLHILRLNKSSFESVFRKRETLGLELLKNHIIINGFDYFMEVFEKYGKN